MNGKEHTTDGWNTEDLIGSDEYIEQSGREACSKETTFDPQGQGESSEHITQPSKTNRVTIVDVLQKLNLTDKYPGKLTREDLYQITKNSLFDEKPKRHEDLACYFIQNIVQYNYKARELHIIEDEGKKLSTVTTSTKRKFRQRMDKREEEKKELEVSPMDVILAVFVCCDNICRQDLVSHLWSCRLSVPLVIQETPPPGAPSFYLWPLRSLAMRWEIQVDGQLSVRDGSLVKEAMKSIAFIRFGDISLSKSALINSVISASEKTHSVFVHRDSPGNSKQRHLVDGLIDIGWYFPTPRTESKPLDHFQDSVMFLNLHGDAYQFGSQLDVLSNLANTITILCKVKDLHNCKIIFKKLLDKEINLLVIFTDEQIDAKNEDVIDDVIDVLKADENQLEFMEIKGKTRAKIVAETRNMLRKLSEGKYKCLENVFDTDLNIKFDENTADFVDAKKDAKAISKLLRDTPYETRKSLHLPLQSEPWIRWAIADKERLRSCGKKMKENFFAYMAERKKIMKECRLKQIDIIKSKENGTLLQLFLKSLCTDNEMKRKLFLRWLKLEFDDLSREELGTVYKRYQEIMTSMQTAEELTKESLKNELKKLDEEIALRSFGLEHMLREMGQMSEAFMYQTASQDYHLTQYNIPTLAANILLDGYPFELLDGHVNSVPLVWVKQVLNEVERILQSKINSKKVRIKVITALGIQSSGKSTMLNALFGCQYAVSAGRCTRGVYCQFIPVERKYRKELELDYVLAIDTEGLRAQELSAIGHMIKHDNELSTFVIGLADITILNLMGENTTYLDEILPISVHAFLRMNIVTMIKPRCVIVHQNVIKENSQKLLHQGRILEEKLNMMTELACKFERIENKPFTNIIKFDVGRDVCFLSALLEGIQPMAPINTRYSEELNVFKQTLIKGDKNRCPKTLDSFIRLLENLWRSIKKDDFVYQFLNTVEIEARSKLDDYWCKVSWNFRQLIHQLISTGYVHIQNCKTVEEVECQMMLLELETKKKISEEYQMQRDKFEAFVEDADIIMKEAMKKLSFDMEKRFDDLCADLATETSAKLKDFEQDKRRELSLRQEKIRYKDTLKAEIEKVVKSSEDKPEEEIADLFEKYWTIWKLKILKENPRRHANIDIENDAFETICKAFSSGTDALTTYLKHKSLESYNIEDFEPKEIMSTFSCLFHHIGYSKTKEAVKYLAYSLFDKVTMSLDLRGLQIRPYTKMDIVRIVVCAQKHFQSKRKSITLKPQQEVYLTVIACGHAIKKLRSFHELYETVNDPETLLENEKTHFFRMFKAFYNEAETINLLVVDCQEIIKRGMQENISRTFPGKICVDLKNSLFFIVSKSLTLAKIMVELATCRRFNDFQVFIGRPEKSIAEHIAKCVESYANQKDKPLCRLFKVILSAIKEEVSLTLQKSVEDGKENFQKWLETFQRNAKGVIILQNIERLQDLGKGKNIDMEQFSEKIKLALDRIVEEIDNGMISYLNQNFESFKNQVVDETMKSIIGCTESCPFCGAICVVAHAGHEIDHYTTHHRPQGCKGWHKKATKFLVTETCSVNVSSDKKFYYFEDDVEKLCAYKDYRKVYPNWKITVDETGEDTSFWNCFFKEFATDIAGKELKVPPIPLSWNDLDWNDEIRKLNEYMTDATK